MVCVQVIKVFDVRMMLGLLWRVSCILFVLLIETTVGLILVERPLPSRYSRVLTRKQFGIALVNALKIVVCLVLSTEKDLRMDQDGFIRMYVGIGTVVEGLTMISMLLVRDLG